MSDPSISGNAPDNVDEVNEVEPVTVVPPTISAIIQSPLS